MRMVSLGHRAVAGLFVASWLAACGGSEVQGGSDGLEEDGGIGGEPGDCPPPPPGCNTPECFCLSGWGSGAGGTATSSGGAPTSAACGNGQVDIGEACDGMNVGQQTCSSATMGARPIGALACSPTCTLVVTGCASGNPGGGTGGMQGTGGAFASE
jgi:hypothetical protein